VLNEDEELTMCVVSMIGDHYGDKWGERWGLPRLPNGPGVYTIPAIPEVTKEDFEALKKEVLEMKELLKRAVAYDKANNEPDCEIEEKMAVLRKVAELVGVNLDDVIKPPKGA
jgi:hypothetical protein